MVRKQTNTKAKTAQASRKAATRSNRTAKVTKTASRAARAKTPFGRRSARHRTDAASQSGLFGMWRWFNPFWFAMGPGR
jgi:hypothetical protein